MNLVKLQIYYLDEVELDCGGQSKKRVLVFDRIYVVNGSTTKYMVYNTQLYIVQGVPKKIVHSDTFTPRTG